MQEILVHSLVRKQRSHVPWSNLSCPLQLINLRATTRESTHFIERMQQLRPNTIKKINIFFRKRISNWRWGRNRTGRPLSLPQIHQKIIWMLSNYHNTTSEHWQRTPGTQKGSPFSSKGGRTKYKKRKRETKELGMETQPREGVLNREVSKHQETLLQAGLWGVLESQRAT